MKNWIRDIVCLLVVMLPLVANAQFDPQIGQYMYIKTAYNPAAAGEDDMMLIAGLHRMQMTGIRNAPMTTHFSVSSPFVLGKTRHGAGVRFMNDKFGLFSNQSVYLQYAYRQKLGKGYLSAGVELGFTNVGFEGDSVNLSQLTGSEYHVESDPVIASGKKSGMGFDMSVGAYYSTPVWYAGISYSHLTQPRIVWDDVSSIRLRGTMYAMGGYRWRLRNRDFVLCPSAMLMTDFVGWDLNLTLMTQFRERWRWGIGYRVASNVAILLGVEIISGLNLGYTYELPTSKLLLESYGSHELYLSYALDILRPKRTNRYRSVRYL